MTNSYSKTPLTFSISLEPVCKSLFFFFFWYQFQECCLVLRRKMLKTDILHHRISMQILQIPHSSAFPLSRASCCNAFRHASSQHVLLSLSTQRLQRGQLKSFKDLVMLFRIFENFHFDFCLCSGSGCLYLFSQSHTHFSHFREVAKEHWMKTRSLFSYYLSCPSMQSFLET